MTQIYIFVRFSLVYLDRNLCMGAEKLFSLWPETGLTMPQSMYILPIGTYFFILIVLSNS